MTAQVSSRQGNVQIQIYFWPKTQAHNLTRRRLRRLLVVPCLCPPPGNPLVVSVKLYRSLRGEAGSRGSGAFRHTSAILNEQVPAEAKQRKLRQEATGYISLQNSSAQSNTLLLV